VTNEPDIEQLEELLAGIKGSLASLAPYNLTLYRSQGSETADSARFTCCCALVQDSVSNDVARHFFAKDLAGYFDEGVPAVCRYGGAFFGFVVPFTRYGDNFCLVGDGVRDTSIDLWQLAALSRKGGADVFSLFPHVETLYTATAREVEGVTHEVAKEICRSNYSVKKVSEIAEPVSSAAEPCDLNPARQSASDHRLAAISTFLQQMDQTKTLTETIAICCETIVTLVAPPKVALALRQGDGTSFSVS
jgi:hypothetical protein